MACSESDLSQIQPYLCLQWFTLASRTWPWLTHCGVPGSKGSPIDVDKISIGHECVGSMSNRRRSEGLCYLGCGDMWRQRTSSLFQAMTCRLFIVTPLHVPMLSYCQWYPQEQTFMQFETKWKHFHWTKCLFKMSSTESRPFCLGFKVLVIYFLTLQMDSSVPSPWNMHQWTQWVNSLRFGKIYFSYEIGNAWFIKA